MSRLERDLGKRNEQAWNLLGYTGLAIKVQLGFFCKILWRREGGKVLPGRSSGSFYCTVLLNFIVHNLKNMHHIRKSKLLLYLY